MPITARDVAIFTAGFQHGDGTIIPKSASISIRRHTDHPGAGWAESPGR